MLYTATPHGNPQSFHTATPYTASSHGITANQEKFLKQDVCLCRVARQLLPRFTWYELILSI